MYEVIYDVDEDVRNIRETFAGSWFDLQDFIKNLRDSGFYNIAVNNIGSEEENEINEDW